MIRPILAALITWVGIIELSAGDTADAIKSFCLMIVLLLCREALE